MSAFSRHSATSVLNAGPLKLRNCMQKLLVNLHKNESTYVVVILVRFNDLCFVEGKLWIVAVFYQGVCIRTLLLTLCLLTYWQIPHPCQFVSSNREASCQTTVFRRPTIHQNP